MIFGAFWTHLDPIWPPKSAPKSSKNQPWAPRALKGAPKGAQGSPKVPKWSQKGHFGSHFGHFWEPFWSLLHHILRIFHTSFVFSWDVMRYHENFTFGSPSGHFCFTFGHILASVVVSRGMSWDIAEIRLSSSLSRVSGPWDPLLPSRVL